mmetsp:Transcript_20551/g.58957  ORF Transcript_20551/g.58957 Transcript_20551/m.58957 type:complete len:236 (-) Transcript_20551:2152-2859(-)
MTATGGSKSSRRKARREKKLLSIDADVDEDPPGGRRRGSAANRAKPPLPGKYKRKRVGSTRIVPGEAIIALSLADREIERGHPTRRPRSRRPNPTPPPTPIPTETIQIGLTDGKHYVHYDTRSKSYPRRSEKKRNKELNMMHFCAAEGLMNSSPCNDIRRRATHAYTVTPLTLYQSRLAAQMARACIESMWWIVTMKSHTSRVLFGCVLANWMQLFGVVWDSTTMSGTRGKQWMF